MQTSPPHEQVPSSLTFLNTGIQQKPVSIAT